MINKNVRVGEKTTPNVCVHKPDCSYFITINPTANLSISTKSYQRFGAPACINCSGPSTYCACQAKRVVTGVKIMIVTVMIVILRMVVKSCTI